MGFRTVMLYFGPNQICKLNAYLLATNGEKNEGRWEKSSGRTTGSETEVTASKIGAAASARD